MTFGISRVHGALVSPKNFAGVSLQDFTLTFWAGDTAVLAADAALAGGALDQAFRTAVQTVGSVSRVGTLTSNTLNFAVESLGFDGGNSGGGFLGTGPTDANPANTAAALTAAVQALGTVTNSAGGVVHLTSATVTAFVY